MGERLNQRDARERIEDLERPALDDRSYRVVTLPNRLEVLLIHDPNTDKASAALDVNVGSFSDAEDMPGIAHAVEHLLFMGTEKVSVEPKSWLQDPRSSSLGANDARCWALSRNKPEHDADSAYLLTIRYNWTNTFQYPKENAYNQYLNAHSGHSNAYTASTSTNYYFELAASSSTPTSSKAPSPNATQETLPTAKDDSPLWGALDRFGQFFVAPLFLEDTLDRELKAVDSENKKNLQSDTWRLHQLNKALSNPNHPYCHFSTGSYKTLHDDPIVRGVKIRDEFIKFYSTHYSANQMKLVILGRESLDTLEEWAEEIFSKVPNKDLPQKRWDDVPVYTKNELMMQTFARPVFELRSLELTFLYRDEEDLYESHPSRYLSHLIGHEGPGSIFGYIKAKGWANGLGAGGSSLCPGTGIFTINVKLTEDGLKHYKEVTQVIFQYIAMIREQPPQQWVVEEQIRMSEVDFRFKQKSPPSRTTSALAREMQKTYNRKMLLSGPAVIRKFDAEAISQAMTFLRPDNFRLNVVSQIFPGGWDQKEKWYGTEYINERIPEDFVAEIKHTFENSAKERPKELHFPHKNEFIPNRLEVEKKEVEVPLKAPKLIRMDESVRTWYKKDDQFWVPKANVHIYLRTPIPHVTARTTVMSALYRNLVSDALVEYSYDADISGLVYEFNNHTAGLSISVEGYNDKLHVLLEKVLVQVRDLEVREDRFEIVREHMSRSFRNWDFGQPFHQVGTFSRYLKSEKSFLTDELLREIENITAQDIRLFYPQILSQAYIEVLAHGNLHKEEALQITDLVEKTMKPKRLPPSHLGIQRTLILPPGSNYVYERQLKDPANVNHCIEYSLYVGNTMDRDLRAKVLLLSQMTDEPAFNQLRTIEQLGYVVFSGTAFADTWAGYRILIQSEKDCDYLEGRIDHFLNSFEKMLQEMKEDEFEGHKRAVINKRLEKLKNLEQEGNRFWNHIFSDAYDFSQADEDVLHVEPLTKQSLVDFFHHYISPKSPTRAKLSVHLVARAKPKEATPAERKTQAVTSLSTILKAEKIDADTAKLESRFEALSLDNAKADDALGAELLAYLAEDLELEGDVVEKVLDEAKAALGLAREKRVSGPVRIEDVHVWKAGLQMSTGVRPVKDLGEFMEGNAKL
ncbi:Metalloenzyme, LuxS/M16 peptidase-like protein [Clohesyomyces aquaticus]|uniref:Metalloenzyme, LuxS/M16 peptidase-like protein n=1 Tax=Clohesyomyces aquaticus TaxID=1231657 RepID=A0A1Y1YHU1_9PLEO|nr:Metalloenzyme, LuxS/M16 peptidase-like protein [Clohesyomyces aquaticus]